MKKFFSIIKEKLFTRVEKQKNAPVCIPTKEHAERKLLRERTSTINTIPQDINMWNSREYLFRNEIRRR